MHNCVKKKISLQEKSFSISTSTFNNKNKMNFNKNKLIYWTLTGQFLSLCLR